MLELCQCPNIYGPDCIYVYIRGVNINALTHVINLKMLTR